MRRTLLTGITELDQASMSDAGSSTASAGSDHHAPKPFAIMCNVIGVTPDMQRMLRAHGFRKLAEWMSCAEFADWFVLFQDFPKAKLMALTTASKFLLNGHQVTPGLTWLELARGARGPTESLAPTSAAAAPRISFEGAPVDMPPTAQEPDSPAIAAAPVPVFVTPSPERFLRPPLKLPTDAIKKFDGRLEAYEAWSAKTRTTLRQTEYKYLIREELPDHVDLSDKETRERNDELWAMLDGALYNGGLGHLSSTVAEGDGRELWLAIIKWAGENHSDQALIEKHLLILDSLRLVPGQSGMTYVSKFSISYKRLLALQHDIGEKQAIKKILKGIQDPDYQPTLDYINEKRRDKKATDVTFEDVSRQLESKFKQLEADRESGQSDHPAVVARRTYGAESSLKKSGALVPLFPKNLLAVTPKKVREGFLLWRDIWIKEGRNMRADEFHGYSEQDAASMTAASNTGQQRRSALRAARRTDSKKGRRAASSPSGTTTSVTFRDEEDRTRTRDDDDDDSDEDSQMPPRPRRRHRAGRAKRSRRVADCTPYIVIDSGADIDIIGGAGWRVLQELDQSVRIDGPLSNMTGFQLPIVSAITAYDHPIQGTILLGIGVAAFNSDGSQKETLLNSHSLRKFGVEVHDVALRDNGRQCISFDGITVPLDFVDDKTLRFPIRAPTQDELERLATHWLIPRMPDVESGIFGRSIRRAPAAIVPAPVDWSSRLGFPNKGVLAKTLVATTQLCASPVEMDNREHPRQHRKMRLLELHPKRISGRTDSDTFFSSAESVNGYRCIQLFVVVETKFISVHLMKREAESHTALLDFIRTIGAPNQLLTDNSKTQSGTMWSRICRSYAIQQIHCAPHNQNQNHAERHIQIVKQRLVHLMRQSDAPAVFWSYGLNFIVDCLNHLAKETIGWRTPYERQNGMTPDISMFRFGFWEPVWYYEPTASFPHSNFLPGRFIGIAWQHGDAFTYRIWTTPSGDWKDGRELIRNVVKSRAGVASPPTPNPAPEAALTPVPNSSVEVAFSRSPAAARGGSRRRTTERIDDRIRVEESPPPPDVEAEETGAADDTARSRNATPQSSCGSRQARAAGAGNDGDVAPASLDPEELATRDRTQRAANKKRRCWDQVDDLEEFNPLEIVDDMAGDVNNAMSGPATPATLGGAEVKSIVGHDEYEGCLRLKVLWDTGEHSWMAQVDMKDDYPKMLAEYVLGKQFQSASGAKCLSWATRALRAIKRAEARLRRLYVFEINESSISASLRRATVPKKKKKKFMSAPVMKYGVKVPRNVPEAFRLDEENGNSFWKEAIKAEIQSLTDMGCFKFEDPEFRPSDDYQKTTLVMIFDVKQDLRRKARLVAGGHLVDVLDNNVYSSTVKGISVKLLHVIAHKTGMRQLCGDVANAYVNAYTNERVYAIAGAEFGELRGRVVIIVKALYGLSSSSERWHSHFSDTLRSIGFKPTRYDRDVWIRLSATKVNYEYLCTHVDDFMIVSHNPEAVMQAIQDVYAVKSIGPPEYYLGNDYKMDKKGRWCIGCKKYLSEAIRRVEAIFGTLNRASHPSETGDHPEEDNSKFLGDEEHRQFQMLIGMLVWLVTIGRSDVSWATSSLSRFTAQPREGHLKRALRVFGYLKKRPNRRIVVDSRDPIVVGGEEERGADLRKELGEYYDEASEEIDDRLPEPLVDELAITVFVDSDHAHDKVTRRSCTGMLIFVGRTPVFHMSKRQGSIETSTYGAEFCAMRTAVEELISVRYMLRCLGVKVSKPSLVLGDNRSVIINATVKESLLKKKHVAIAYHKVRESAAAGIAHPVKVDGKDNYADALTKPQTQKEFAKCIGGYLYG